MLHICDPSRPALTLLASLGNGLQGFQTPIANDSFIVDGVGALGTTHTERNLTYFEVELSGHMYAELSCISLT